MTHMAMAQLLSTAAALLTMSPRHFIRGRAAVYARLVAQAHPPSKAHYFEAMATASLMHDEPFTSPADELFRHAVESDSISFWLERPEAIDAVAADALMCAASMALDGMNSR